MRELFIYYRIPSAAADEALAAALALQARLRQRHPGLTARLLRRPDDANEQQTWMETYAYLRDTEPAGVTSALEAEIADEARVLAPFIAGARHTEVFIPCAS
ncbi:DUF4936 family protein [Piscinibacter sp. XHJ-5]|uniref:DUF4936 family protein n=1 Tax=Piscinibacter sp. XHJ-5 TaxID=3037797 RepID=UPI002452B6F3|nr:DUF4936 family protein [Piscinibacter sp. XHJ-5]